MQHNSCSLLPNYVLISCCKLKSQNFTRGLPGNPLPYAPAFYSSVIGGSMLMWMHCSEFLVCPLTALLCLFAPDIASYIDA